MIRIEKIDGLGRIQPPGDLTWMLQMMVFKRYRLSNMAIWGIYLKFMGVITYCHDSSMKIDLMSCRHCDEIEVNVSVSCV